MGDVRYKLCALACILLVVAGKASAFGFSGTTLQGGSCGRLVQGFGPYDYTARGNKKNIELVEQYHFVPETAELIEPAIGSFAADIDYTLRAIPNHHRALYTLIRLATEPHYDRRHPGWWREPIHPPECYLERAISFSPKDVVPKFLYALYLQKINRLPDAEAWYKKALQQAPKYAEAHYNLGLLYLELGRFDDARKHAELAYRYGYPLPGLKQKLSDAGYPLD